MGKPQGTQAPPNLSQSLLTCSFSLLACRSAMKDFELGHDFLWITMTSSDMITFATSPPDPKTIKRKALVLIKARKENEDEDPDPNNMFPSGIENEVIFMEITGKTLSNLYSSCQVSALLQIYFWLIQTQVEIQTHSIFGLLAISGWLGRFEFLNFECIWLDCGFSNFGGCFPLIANLPILINSTQF